MQQTFDRFDFGTSGEGRLFENLIQMCILLDSQFKKLVNNRLLEKLLETSKSAEDPEKQRKFKKVMHLYLSLSSVLNYQKHVAEGINEDEVKALLPNQDLLKPQFKFVNSQYQYNSTGGDEEMGSPASLSPEKSAELKQGGFSEHQLSAYEEVKNVLRILALKKVDTAEELSTHYA